MRANFRSLVPKESKVESCEHQDNADICDQAFPESVSKEREVYTDYDCYHRHHVKDHRYPCAHLSKTLFHFLRPSTGVASAIFPNLCPNRSCLVAFEALAKGLEVVCLRLLGLLVG